MKIADITGTSKGIDVTGMVVAHIDKEAKAKDGSMLHIQEMDFQDPSGSIMLSLFNWPVAIKIGDKAIITNGYAKEYRGKAQLSVGKWGKLELLPSHMQEGKKLPNPLNPPDTIREIESIGHEHNFMLRACYCGETRDSTLPQTEQ